MKPPRSAAFLRPRSAGYRHGGLEGPPMPPALVAPRRKPWRSSGWRNVPEGLERAPQASFIALGPGILPQRFNQISQARQVVERIDEALHPRHPGRTEHQARQLAKFRPDLVFSIRILVVAAGALAQPSHLAAVGEGD